VLYIDESLTSSCVLQCKHVNDFAIFLYCTQTTIHPSTKVAKNVHVFLTKIMQKNNLAEEYFVASVIDVV
jgi:hypothetical protein